MRKLMPWVAAVLILIIGFGTIYVVVQQAQRNDANYPQIQTAEDTAASINQGNLETVQVGQTVDMAKSLASFTILYDMKGKPVLGTGLLNGKVPKIDLGALQAAKGKDYNAVTWQPAKGVRIAAVTVAAKNYYVLSGRNMKQIEKNEDTTLLLSAIGLAASLVVLVLMAGFAQLERVRTSQV